MKTTNLSITSTFQLFSLLPPLKARENLISSLRVAAHLGSIPIENHA